MNLDVLYAPVSWVLLRWHDLFDAIGVGPNWAWVLSIVFLVITARSLLFRLFLKQVDYQRSMHAMQPRIQSLREKHAGDKHELNRQLMALQQAEGFNPLAGCLPTLLQLPVFVALFHVLRHVPTGRARVFEAPLTAAFTDTAHTIVALGGDPAATRIVIVALLVVSAAATLGTQLLVRASAVPSPQGTAAAVQRLMLYAIPLGTPASGLLFHLPLGVLLYWFTTNLWTLGQQAYVARFHPPVATVRRLRG